jgi:hypothetical protein
VRALLHGVDGRAQRPGCFVVRQSVDAEQLEGALLGLGQGLERVIERERQFECSEILFWSLLL